MDLYFNFDLNTADSTFFYRYQQVDEKQLESGFIMLFPQYSPK
jgi:hypothetical protein